MRISMFIASSICVLTLAVSPASAIKDPETSVVFPDTSTCDGAPAVAAGVGVREATFGIDVYAVVLYANAKAKGISLRATDECVKIRMRFVRDVGAGKIKKAWIKGFKKNGLAKNDATVQKLLSITDREIKKHKEMILEIHGAKVVYTYMGKSVTITGAAKLGKAIRKIYLGSGSPTPELIKSVKKRGVAKP